MKYRTIIIIVIVITTIILVIKFGGYSVANVANFLFESVCTDPAILNPKDFSWTRAFRSEWEVILKEYQAFNSQFQIPYHKELNSHVASCDTNSGWKTLYLRAFGIDTDLTKYFPQTMKLINSSPCTLAFFSVIEPGAMLSPHKGIYKGVIRYHLGLIVPDEPEKCFLRIAGSKLSWRAGSDLMFDDLFEHSVENNTNQPRVILFLDIKRDFRNVFLNWINSLLLYVIQSNDVLTDTVDNANKKSLRPKI
jgi:aspartyl/asparaginyl beta-hydroxylase (cupin superfamily)